MGTLRMLPGRFGRAPRRVPALPKKADGFYISKEWRSLVGRIKRQRGPWCERCGAGGQGVRVIGDHKIEIRDGGAKLDDSNVELMCAGCHGVKTAAAKADRVRNRGGG